MIGCSSENGLINPCPTLDKIVFNFCVDDFTGAVGLLGANCTVEPAGKVVNGVIIFAVVG